MHTVKDTVSLLFLKKMIRRRLLAALAVAAALGFTVPAAASIPAVTPVAAVQLPATADRCCSGDANGDAEALPCGYPLEGGDRLARSSAALGDIDGDGTPDVAVGTSRDGDGANHAGAVYVLNLNADGTEKHTQKISAAYGMVMEWQTRSPKEASMPWKRKIVLGTLWVG